MRLHVVYLISIFSVVPSIGLFAQLIPGVAIGMRVRVKQECSEVFSGGMASRSHLECPKHTGTVTSIAADGLVLGIDGTESRVGIPLASVSSLSIFRGRKSGAGTGALVGFVVGAVYGASLEVPERGSCGAPCWIWPNSGDGASAVLAVFCGGIGTGIGAILGALFRSDRWEEVPLDRLRVSFGPGREGFGLAFSVAY